MRSVAIAFDALLFETILKPLAQGNDELGDYGIATFAQTLAARMNGRAEP